MLGVGSEKGLQQIVITRGFMHADCCISTAHHQLQPTGLLGVLLFKQMNIMQTRLQQMPRVQNSAAQCFNLLMLASTGSEPHSELNRKKGIYILKLINSLFVLVLFKCRCYLSITLVIFLNSCFIYKLSHK